jgi:hypothetical protein
MRLIWRCRLRVQEQLLDAKTLTKTLMNSSSIEQAFDTYYQERYSDLTNHLEQGRLLKTIFWNLKTQRKRLYLAW